MRKDLHKLLLCVAAIGALWLTTPYCHAADSIEVVRSEAEQGDASAQNTLGYMYAFGNGVVKDEVEAVKWFRKAADKGHADAQSNLAYMYRNGNGVPKNELEAAKWDRKAADEGNLLTGRQVSRSSLMKSFRRAADQGDAGAQFTLGLMYRSTGVVKDEVEAVKWFRKAADQGEAGAQYNLGAMYADGRGVVKDEAEAYKWFLLAGAQGNEVARSNIPKIELSLTPQQRADGQKIARDFKPQDKSTKASTNH